MIVKLSKIADIKNGKCNSQDSVNTGIYPLFDRSLETKYSNTYLFDCESIIVPGEGTSFIPRYYKGKFNLHQRCYCIHNFKNVDGKYLYYNLLANKKYFSTVAVGSTVPSLRLRHFLDMELAVHAPAEQHHIVNTISLLLVFQLLSLPILCFLQT